MEREKINLSEILKSSYQYVNKQSFINTFRTLFLRN